MTTKMQKLKTVLRWIFNILCLLIVSLLFLVGAWTRNLHFLWLIIPIVLWYAAFKRKLAGWLALGFLACIVGIVVWLFLPDSGNWRPYNFDYELKDLEAKRAVPDAENAAIAYQKIIASLDVNNAPPFYDGGKRNECNEPSTSIIWKGVDHPETAAFIDARKDIITDTMAASTMEKCAFAIQTDPFKFSANTQSGMRKMAYLMLSAANRDLGEGRTSNAVDKYANVILMGRQLEQQPLIIYFLVGCAVERLGINKLKYAVIESNCSPDDRRLIHELFAATNDDWPQLWPTISQHEKMFSKNMLGMMTYEINDDGIVRFRRGDIPIPKGICNSTQPRCAALRKKMQKLAALEHWFVAPHNPRDLSRIWDEEFERAKKLYDANRPQSGNKPDFKSTFKCWLKGPYRAGASMSAQMVMPTYAKIHQTYLHTIAARRAMHILLALREYKDANGHWPDTLDQIKDKIPAEAIIDPFNGGSFIYKTKGDKFLLYSVGANKIDEKGKPKPSCRDGACKIEKSPSDDLLIWPQKKEQAKEFFDANSPPAK